MAITRKNRIRSAKGCWALDSGTFNYDVVFAVAVDKKAIEKFVKRRFKADLTTYEEWKDVSLEKKAGLVVQFSNGAMLMWLKQFDSAVLCHEAIHLTQALFKTVDIRSARESDEAFAYQTEYYFRKACEAVL